ncbi:MAG TPA: hypothetical protein VE360_12335, partial [Pyrinomonadaceae bacterium]|nr:hypothetical protein [Pyrinomonadaceae bacterium]
AVPELKSWDDLSWGHLAGDEPQLRALAHVKVNRPPLVPTENDKGRWGHNSAHMAYITKQLPARVAIHARELLSTEKP